MLVNLLRCLSSVGINPPLPQLLTVHGVTQTPFCVTPLGKISRINDNHVGLDMASLEWNSCIDGPRRLQRGRANDGDQVFVGVNAVSQRCKKISEKR